MFEHIINFIKSFFYVKTNNYNNKIVSTNDNTFVYIPKQPKKETKQEPIFKSIEFLNQIKNFKFIKKSKQ